MKTITRFLFLISPAILLSTSVAQAQCLPGYTWNQPSNNVIDFTNTSTPIIPNSTYFTWDFGDNQYDWQQNPSHTYNVPGSYVVCLTMYDSLSSCQLQFCDSITVYGTVFCNNSMYVNQTQLASCATCADGSADAVPLSGTAPFTYLWSNGETTSTAIVLAPGINTVCITDANSCQVCDTVNIMYSNSSSCQASFTSSQTQNNIVDFTSTSTGISAGTFYMWDYGDNSWGYYNPSSHTYQYPGNYIVCLTIYDSLSACQSTWCDSIYVTGIVNCNVYASASIVQAASCSTCADGTGTAYLNGGTGPFTYSWSDGQTTQYATGLVPGSYTVCITDVNGCSACDTLVMDTSACSISFTYTQTSNNPVQFYETASSPSTMFIMWDFGDGNYAYGSNPTNNYAQSGTYWVCATVYDSSNCSSTFCDSVTVLGNPNTFACSANFVIYPDSTNTNLAWIYNMSTGGPNMTYLWSWGDNTFDSVPWPSHVYSSTGAYTICLIVTDSANQCSDTMCQVLIVPRLTQEAASAPYYVNVVPTGVQEQAQETFTLFPNPASTEIKIRSDYSLQGKQFIILDVTGRTVMTGMVNESSITINSLDSGMYILQIENSKGGFSAQRFMKD